MNLQGFMIISLILFMDRDKQTGKGDYPCQW